MANRVTLDRVKDFGGCTNAKVSRALSAKPKFVVWRMVDDRRTSVPSVNDRKRDAEVLGAQASSPAWCPTEISKPESAGGDACAPSTWYNAGMRIKVIVHQAAEGGFWAEVPTLPGCATQSDTFEELLQNLHEAVEGCLSVEVEPLLGAQASPPA